MGRVVAELGRPETPAETAARKAAFSKVYRGSQNFRSLIAAIIATVVVVGVIIFGVPRGELEPPAEIKVAEIASRVERDTKHPIVVPVGTETWHANKARYTGGSPATWEITYAPGDGLGFLRVSQAINGDNGWASRELSASTLGETVELDGVSWQEYTFRDPSKSGNVSYALGTQAGTDHILVFGSSSQELITETATGLSAQITELKEVTP